MPAPPWPVFEGRPLEVLELPKHLYFSQSWRPRLHVGPADNSWFYSLKVFGRLLRLNTLPLLPAPPLSALLFSHRYPEDSVQEAIRALALDNVHEVFILFDFHFVATQAIFCCFLSTRSDHFATTWKMSLKKNTFEMYNNCKQKTEVHKSQWWTPTFPNWWVTEMFWLGVSGTRPCCQVIFVWKRCCWSYAWLV